MKIDAHHHLWHYRPDQYSWEGDPLKNLKRDFLAEEFSTEMSSAGIDSSVIVQSFHSVEETRWMLSEAQRREFVMGVVGWVDLESNPVRELDDLCASPALVGIRHIVQNEPVGFLARPAFQRGLSLLASRNLAYDLLILPHQLPEAIALVERFPEQNFVLDHLAKPLVPGVDRAVWRRDLARLAAFPRVWAKLSGFVTEFVPSVWDAHEIHDLLKTAFDLFGEDRVMLSSNWPVGNLAGSYRWTMQWSLDLAAALPETAQKKIFETNAVLAYGLRRNNPF